MMETFHFCYWPFISSHATRGLILLHRIYFTHWILSSKITVKILLSRRSNSYPDLGYDKAMMKVRELTLQLWASAETNMSTRQRGFFIFIKLKTYPYHVNLTFLEAILPVWRARNCLGQWNWLMKTYRSIIEESRVRTQVDTRSCDINWTHGFCWDYTI